MHPPPLAYLLHFVQHQKHELWERNHAIAIQVCLLHQLFQLPRAGLHAEATHSTLQLPAGDKAQTGGCKDVKRRPEVCYLGPGVGSC